MGDYRKKPVVVQAFRWTGGPDQQEDPEWATEALVNGTMSFNGDDLVITTLEGPMLVSPGDYIIRGVKGELYPCKPDIFEMTYDPA